MSCWSNHQTLIREQKYARILSLLHRIDDAAFSDIVPERFLRTLVNECTRFLEMDFGFLIGAGPGNDDYQVLAASGNADEAFRNRTFSKHQGLAGWALHKEKNLKIPRLRREAKEHYLFFPQEKLPHQGTFMAFHSHIPLGQPMAMVFRVEGLLLVNGALIARGAGEAVETIPITGIQLPRVLGISVQAGSPLALDALRGQPTGALAEVPPTTRVVPVPFVPEEC